MLFSVLGGRRYRVMASDTLAPSKTREKVALKPGFHLIDWMNLMKRADVSGRKGAPLRRISMKEVREHKSRYDCWTVYNKKVYNITNYMDYHPGNSFFASLAHAHVHFHSLHFPSHRFKSLQGECKSLCLEQEKIVQIYSTDTTRG